MSSSASASAGNGRRAKRRSALLAGCAIGTALFLAGHSEPASSQAFQANPGVIVGTVNRLVTGPTTETITIGSDTAIITWFPNSDTNPFPFLPAANVATFNNGAGVTDFVVLNRIGSSQTIQFDGTVISRIKTGSDEVAGGTLLFSSPGGIIVGGKALFDVGNLVLTTLTVATLDEAGPGPYLVAGDFRFGPSDVPPAAIVTGAGTQFTATSENSYIAMVAPRIAHGGTTDVNGSAAYIAAERLEFTVDQGLFDIVVETGSDNQDALVHSGATGGPASTGGADNHRIYMVAVPRNQAITALLSGEVGFDPAVSVAVDNGAIILSAGFDVAGDDVLRTTGAGPDASFLIQDAEITSDLSGYAVADMFAGGGAGSLTFDQDVNLFADGRARLFAAAGQAVTVLGAARVSAARSESSDPAVIDLTGGEAIASAAAGGTLSVSGSLIVDASGMGSGDGGGAPAGAGAGGTARLIAGGGDVQVGGDVEVRADGAGADNLFNRAGDGAGGQASVESSGGGSIAVGGDVRVSADGRGGSVQAADQNAGSGTGGRATLTSDGGSIAVAGGADLLARGLGGELATASGALAGAPGSGGLVVVSAAAAGPLTVAGAVAIDVRGQGGGGALGGAGGDGSGGTATLAADGAAIDLAATAIEAGGFGGAGGAGGPGGAGGTGGAGRGGNVDLSAGPAGTLTLDDLQAQANGQGGAGGIGGAHDVAGGSGGGGGEATGGTVEAGSGGGDLLVTGAAGIQLAASGLGGAGAAGGEGFGAAASGGDGGAGGAALGGDARLVSSGGSIGAGPATVTAGSIGGAGAAGGTAGGTGGTGGAGGDAAGGGARLLALGGTVAVGAVEVIANAVGGAGGDGDNGGAGGAGGDAAAGTDEAAFTRGAYVSAEGGDLEVAAAVIEAVATGGGGGDGSGGGAGGDGSGGGVRFGSLAGTLRANGPVALAANGFGGDGGAGLEAAAAGGEGGSGSGGRILLSTQGSPAAAVDAQDAQLFASGIGGDGGAGSPGVANGGDGGDGGAGTGGEAGILAGRGTLGLGNADLAANGAGGAGGAGGDGDPGSGEAGDGGDGATGRGGGVSVSAGSAAATLGDAELGASGIGGLGGSGGSASIAGAGGADAGALGGQARIEARPAAAGDPAGSLTAGAVSVRVEGDAGGSIELLTDLAPATFDSLDIFGRGIDLASASAEDSLLRVDGPALFDIGGDLFLFTIGTGRIDVGGELRLTASGSIIAERSPDDVPAESAIDAGVFIAAARADYLGGSAKVGSGGAIDISAAGIVEGGHLDADAAIDIDGAAIDLAGAVAGGDIDLTSAGDILLGAAAAGDDFLADAGGSFAATSVTANIGSDISIDAVGALRLDNGEASGLIRLASSGAGVVSAGLLDAGTSLVVQAAGDVDLAEARAGAGSITATAGGRVEADDLSAGQNIVLVAATALDVGAAAAGRDVDLAGASVALADGSAGRDIRLAAGGAIDVDLAEAGDDFHADAGGAFTGDGVTVTGLGPDSEAGTGALAGGGNALVQAGGNLRLDAADTAGRLRLVSLGGAVSSDGALSAGRLVAGAASGIALTTVTVTGNIALATAGGDISGAHFDAGGSIGLDAASAIAVESVEARIDIAAKAASVDIGSAAAGRDVTLVAGAGILVGQAEAGDDFRATAGAGFSADSLVATGLGPDSEKGVGAPAATGNIHVTAAGDLRLDDATAAAAIILSSDGNLLSDSLLSAGATLQAGAKLDLDIDDARAGGVLNLAADGDVEAGDLSGGDLIFIGSRGGVTVAGADSDGPISIEAVGGVSAGTLSAGGFIGVDVGGSADIAAANAARFISVTAAGPADLGVLSAGGDIVADASSLIIQSATAGRDVTLESRGGMSAGSVRAGDDFRATSAGAFAGGTAVVTGRSGDNEGDGGNIAIAAGGDLRLDNGDAPDRIELAADSGRIFSDGTLNATSLHVTAGSDLNLANVTVADDLNLSTPNGAITGNSFASQGGIALTASGAVALSAAEAGTGLAVDAASIDLGSAAAVGDIDLTSAATLTLGAAAAGGDLNVEAGGDASFGALDARATNMELLGVATFTGAVLADMVSIAAADVEIAATGSLGGAGTGLVRLSPLAGGEQTVLGGALDGPGFTLSDAEAGRISAAILRVEAPAAAAGGAGLLVRDLSLDGARIGRLELVTRGIARLEGGLRLTGAGAANAIAIDADDRLEIVAPAGGIRLLDAGGMPAGVLTVRAGAIWSASALLIDRLTADPDFAGRDLLLRNNSGPIAPRGQVEAGGVALFVRDSLLVQNSGGSVDLAGITVGAGGLTLTPTGAAPLDVYAFGRRIDPAGGFVTNAAFFAEVRYEPGTAGYSDVAQLNLCFIDSGICNAPDAPLADGSDPVRGPFDVPGPAEIRDDLIDTSFAAEALVDEPVTSGSDTIEWACEVDEESDCPREAPDE